VTSGKKMFVGALVKRRKQIFTVTKEKTSPTAPA
jgi:hypothetical protein